MKEYNTTNSHYPTYTFLLKGWKNVFFNLGIKGLKHKYRNQPTGVIARPQFTAASNAFKGCVSIRRFWPSVVTDKSKGKVMSLSCSCQFPIYSSLHLHLGNLDPGTKNRTLEATGENLTSWSRPVRCSCRAEGKKRFRDSRAGEQWIKPRKSQTPPPSGS